MLATYNIVPIYFNLLKIMNNTVDQKIQLNTEIPEDMAGMRLDQSLAKIWTDFSRGRLQQWIKTGQILVNDSQWRSKDKVQGGEKVSLAAKVEALESRVEAENITLDVVYEDESVIVINKPAGLVVHPAAGHARGTLQNALLYRYPEIAAVPRAGIVHRLDKLTSGLMVAARTVQAHKSLVNQLQDRTVSREYLAVVVGIMPAGGTVDAAIGRHVVDRKRMAVRKDGGKEAISHYRVEKKYRQHTLVRVKLETGRTHQIRVHMASIQYPLIGDPVYGGRFKLPPACSDEFQSTLREFKRQALHAARLEFIHPESGELVSWEVDMPEDMLQLTDMLQKDVDQHK